MKSFLICRANKNTWKYDDPNKKHEHLIIYCKNLKTVFEAWSNQFNSSATKITINALTDDPTLTINPYYVPNLNVSTSVRELNFNCYTHEYWLTIILSLCPNVEKLSFFKLTKEKLKYIAENLEHVKQIDCDYMERDVEDFYTQLISARNDINDNIKIN
jgi:hypothetical protein